MKRLVSKIIWVFIFAIAMAYLEAAIVVYLRRLLGIGDLILQVPPFDAQIAAIELGRELATLIMLLAIGWIAGQNMQSRLSYTFIAFGVWDIFYYLWLNIFIGWPKSFLDPDLLFLIPLPWWGPVLAPVLISILMITGGVAVLRKNEIGAPIRFSRSFWIPIIPGVLLMLYSFMADAIRLLPASSLALNDLRPSQFNWPVYWIGFGLALASILQIIFGQKKKSAD
jgi:hypothetical protein